MPRPLLIALIAVVSSADLYGQEAKPSPQELLHELLSHRPAPGLSYEERAAEAVAVKYMYYYAVLTKEEIKEIERFIRRSALIDNPSLKEKRIVAGFKAIKIQKEKELEDGLQRMCSDLDFLGKFRAERPKGDKPVTEQDLERFRSIQPAFLTRDEKKWLKSSKLSN